MKEEECEDIVEKETAGEEPLKTVQGLREEDNQQQQQLMVSRYHQDDDNVKLELSSQDQNVNAGPNDGIIGSNNIPEMTKRQTSDEKRISSQHMRENYSDSNKWKTDELDAKVDGPINVLELAEDNASPRSVKRVESLVKDQSFELETDCQEDQSAKATASLYGATTNPSERPKCPKVDESKDSSSISSKGDRDMSDGGNVDEYVAHKDENGATYCISNVNAEETGMMGKEAEQSNNSNQPKIEAEEEEDSNVDFTEKREEASNLEGDGWLDRLAILAETLNIPYEQMVAADKKARELQRASLKCRSKLNPQHKVRSVDPKGTKVNDVLPPNHFEGEISSVTGNNIKEQSESFTSDRCENQNKTKTSFDSKSDSSAHSNSSQTTPPLITTHPKESIKSSNIEDTLAFFLDTPPLQKKKKRLSVLPSIPDKVEKQLQKFNEADEKPAEEQQSSKDTSQCFQSSLGNNSKLDIKVTTANVNTSPDVYIFSPLTPNMTEAMLRVTEAISSSIENSGDSNDEKGLDVNRSDDVVPNISPEKASNNDVNVHLSSPPSTLNVDNVVADEAISMNDMMKGDVVHSGNVDTLDTVEESTLVAAKKRTDSSSSVFLLQKPKSLTFKLMYSTQETNPSTPKSFEWQKTAVLDDAFLENEEKKRTENKGNNGTPSTSLPRKRKFNTRSKTNMCGDYRSIFFM